MTWLNLALLLLNLADSVVTLIKNRQQLDAGADAEIAKATAAILLKTQAAQEIMKQVTGMTDQQVDDTLKGLEP